MEKSKLWFRTQPFRFLKLPKDLYENPVYASLSDTAMMLYALLLDRANLSADNGQDWIDQDGICSSTTPSQTPPLHSTAAGTRPQAPCRSLLTLS